MPNNSALFEKLIQKFESVGMPYCILAGYDGYPDNITSDVDFMIHASWSDRLPALIAETAEDGGAHLVQSLQHETSATYFVLALQDGPTMSYLHPDSSCDYKRSNRCWLSAVDILKNRRRHARGFWVPSAPDAFIYYLIKKVDKMSLSQEQADQLISRFAEDPRGCSARLQSLLPPAEASLVQAAVCIQRSFEDPVWQSLQESLPHIRESLHAQAERISLRERFHNALDEARRKLVRIQQPTGLHIVFLGPDGSGKSSVIECYMREMAQAFRRIEYRHLKPGPLRGSGSGPITDPHGQPARGLLGSTAKILHFWGTYVKGGLLWSYPRYLRSSLLVFDRYYHDLLADPARYRYGGPMWLARLLGRLLPQPDLVFILDAPAEVLQSRKQEVAFEESVRQRTAYRNLKSEYARAYIIDSSEPLDKVVASVLTHTVTFMKQRTAKRLGLSRDAARGFHLCKS